ncbi:hypothetical protein AX15_002808 [Amanita polypyramis BW_CC]|nr:hypothetical protein AX15_002808 [Amanita polypyramis BW_CC]
MRRAVDCLSFLFTASALLRAQTVLADDNPFDCHVVTDHYKFDLTPLAGEQTINRTRETPPSQMIDMLKFNLCAELKVSEDVPEKDQCSSGTRACLTIINRKEEESDRIVSVIPVAETSKLDPSYSVSSSPKSLSISFGGHDYPHPSNSTPVQQFMDITLLCDPEVTNSPKFVSYDGARLTVEWITSAACLSPNEDGETPGDDKPEGDGKEKTPHESVGSGIGWFFLMLLFAITAYFALGAYYNYSTYGARGVDLIPHRDFWQEVPYMLRDVVSHLCSNVGARRTSRSGYIAV